MNREDLIKLARQQYASDDLEIDSNAQIRPTFDNEGAWIAAWVYVEMEKENAF
jgi:hypothetical protein